MQIIPHSDRTSKNLYNLVPALLILSLLASFPATGQELAAITEDPFYCAADAFNDAAGTAKMNCTSGDITIASVSNVGVEGDPLTCNEGIDVLTIIELDYALQQNSNSDRYDVIAWISKLGNNPLLPTGTNTACLATSFSSTLDTDSGALDFMQNIDGDLCTDMSYTATAQDLVSSDPAGLFDVLCNDYDEDGYADIPILISWGNNSAELNCGNETPNLQPGNKSKCSVNIINTNVSVVQNPDMSIVKTIVSVDPTGNGVLDAVGDVVNYQVDITNTGDVTLTNVDAGDYVAAGFACDQTVPGATLTPGQVLACTGNYTVTQDDLDGGGTIDNQAFAISDQTGLINDTTSEPIVQNPAMTVVKSVTDVGGDGPTGSVDLAGDVISYSVVVTNSGNITLNNVSLVDPLFDAAPVCTPTAPAILAPTASMTCTGSYAAQQTDIDGGGPINNTATGSSDEAPDASDSASVPVSQTAAMTVVKSVTDVDGDGPTGSVDLAGDVISYSVVVTNSGNITLNNVTLVDPLFDAAPVCTPTAPAILAPTASMTCTGSYAAQQADIDGGGPINNTATASSDDAPDASDSASVPIEGEPSMTVVKSVTDVDGDGPTGSVDLAGDVIAYSVLVTNNGSVTLNNVTLSDPLFDAAPVCTPTAPAILAPTASMTCTGSYAAQQTDIDGGGPINNTATASSDDAPDASDSASVPVSQTAAMTVVKSVTDVGGDGPTGSVDLAGDVIAYSVLVTNAGNITLNNVTLSDPLFDAAPVCTPVAPAVLAPEGTMTCTGSYESQQTDIDGGGPINNTATASSDDAPDASDSASVPVSQIPVIDMMKTSGTTLITAIGQVVDYSFVITNTGNITATAVTLVDANLDVAATCTPVQGTDLPPAGVMNCAGTHIVTTADLALTTLVNTATAESGTTPPSTDSYSIPVEPPEIIAVPVDARWALLMLTMSVLAMGWYFRPATMRR